MKNILIFSVLFFSTAVLGQMSTHVPIEAYRPVKPNEPGYDEYTAGTAKFLAGREREGIRLFQEAAQKGYKPAFRKLGDIFRNRRTPALRPQAEQYYLQAAQQGDTLAMHALADMYMEDNNLPQALEYHLKLAPTFPSIWAHIGDIYTRMGEPKKAAEAYAKFQEVHTQYHWHR
jgi:tetratricopeptide (TPR) repeat protein